MMIGMSSSWLAVKGMLIKEAVEKVFELGFGLVEVGAAHKYEENSVETVLELRNAYPSKKFTLHALFPHFKNGNYPLNLADIKEQDRILKAVKRMFDISERLGASVLGIHGGYSAEVRWVNGRHGFKKLEASNPIPLNTAKRNMKVILEDLVGIAEERDIKLAIEISAAGPSGALMANPESFEWLFSNLASKQLGLLLDIGHLHLAGNEGFYDPYEFVKKFKSKIFEMHLHDCKYGSAHSAVGTGEIDFAKYFKIISRTRLKRIPLVFEYNNSVSEEKALAGKALIEKILGGK